MSAPPAPESRPGAAASAPSGPASLGWNHDRRPPAPRTVETTAGIGRGVRPRCPGDPVGPAGADPVLYVSSALRLPRPVHPGGVPVCWPWFGPGRAAGMEPMHGFVRTTTWELVEETRRRRRGRASCHRLTSDDGDLAALAAPLRRRAALRFGAVAGGVAHDDQHRGRAVRLRGGAARLPRRGDVHQVRVEGLDGKVVLRQGDRHRARAAGRPPFTGETDAVFRTSDPVTLHDPALGRRLVVTTEGASNLVVWNPWEAKAEEVPDIGDDDWERFVCIEGANAFENAVVLDPGSRTPRPTAWRWSRCERRVLRARSPQRGRGVLPASDRGSTHRLTAPGCTAGSPTSSRSRSARSCPGAGSPTRRPTGRRCRAAPAALPHRADGVHRRRSGCGTASRARASCSTTRWPRSSGCTPTPSTVAGSASPAP